MLGIIVFLVALLAMFGWFGYLVAKDPANLFKRSEREQRRRDFGREAGGDGGIVTPFDAGRPDRSEAESFTPGGGDFGGAGSSDEWDAAGGTGSSGDDGVDNSSD